VALTHTQKKFIKKNINKLNLSELSQDLGLLQQEVLSYLNGIWKKEKYEKYVRGLEPENKSGEEFNLVNWVKAEKKILIGFLLLTFFVYANGLNSGLVSDDIGSILNNPNLKTFHFEQFNGLVTTISYFLLYKLGGPNPFLFRFVNLIFHIGSVLLVYLIFQKKHSRNLGIFVASLFAVHPILVESVTWISGGPYDKYTFFFLVSFALWIFYSRNLRNLSFSAFFFLLSIFTNEKAVPLIIIYPIYDFIFRGEFSKMRTYIPHLLATIFFSLLFFGKIAERKVGLQQDYYSSATDVLSPLVQIPIAISEYLRMIFWPTGLTLYHSEMSFSNGQYLIRSLILTFFVGIIIYASFKFLKNRNLNSSWGFIFFWGSFFFISLAVTLAPLGLAWIVAERYVYLGSLGIFAIVGLLVSKLAEKENLRVFVYAVFAVAIVALGVRTIIRNMDWKNEDTLWVATAKTSPSNPTTHNNMGDVYSRHNDLDNAIKEFSKAIEINSNYADAYHNRGSAYQSKGDIENAINDYRKAIEINPNIWQSSQNLAGIYFDKGDYEKSSKYMEAAFSKNPSISLAYSLALIYSKMGDVEKARSLLIDILSVDQSNVQASQLLNNIGY